MNCALGIVVAAILSLTCPANGWAADEDEVRRTFDDYRAAIMGGQGQAATALLSAATVDYYAAMRDLALYAEEDELRRQSTIDMLQALRLRDAIDADRLQPMSGRDLLVYAVDQGWVGQVGEGALAVKAVAVDADQALADIADNNGAVAGQFHFRREDGIWKIDLTPVIQLSSDVLDKRARQEGRSREDYVISILGQLNGAPIDPAIWQPPLKRP